MGSLALPRASSEAPPPNGWDRIKLILLKQEMKTARMIRESMEKHSEENEKRFKALEKNQVDLRETVRDLGEKIEGQGKIVGEVKTGQDEIRDALTIIRWANSIIRKLFPKFK